ncbi:MAG: hypothetical protein ACKVT0_15310 [Planctomycetaceae bacterium]
MTFFERLPFMLFGILVLLILIAFPLYLLFGGLRTFALRPMRRCYDGIETHDTPLRGDAVFVYHTYRGLLLWFTQDEHRVAAPPAEAERLLGRLLRFNLTWGMLSYGMFFIPWLAVGSYFSQRQAIRRQAVVGSASKSSLRRRTNRHT